MQIKCKFYTLSLRSSFLRRPCSIVDFVVNSLLFTLIWYFLLFFALWLSSKSFLLVFVNIFLVFSAFIYVLHIVPLRVVLEKWNIRQEPTPFSRAFAPVRWQMQMKWKTARIESQLNLKPQSINRLLDSQLSGCYNEAVLLMERHQDECSTI